MGRETLAMALVILLGAITAPATKADQPSPIPLSVTDPTDDGSNNPSGKPEPQDAVCKPSVLHGILEDQKDIYTAPFHRRSFKWDLLFLGATGGLIAADKHISGALPSNHTALSSSISDIGLYSMTASVTGIWLSHYKTNNSHARETGVLAAEAVASTAGVYAMSQLIAGRERPTEGNVSGQFWQHNALGSSFPSGHSSFTWAMASVLTHEYPKPWVRWLAYGTATTVSLARTTALKHFSADVAVGGVLGYLIGRHTFNAHCVPGLSSACHSSK